MNKKVFALAVLTSCSLFHSCISSDETLDRDEVTMKAVYQEYDVNYNMVSKKVTAEVAFKTSALGAYVKLGGNDKISFKVDDSEVSTYKELGMKRDQIYWGSRNVPVYKGSAKLNIENNNKITFNWYDSETDQTISVNTQLFHPKVLGFSHDIDNELNTLDGDQLKVTLKDTLKGNETLRVTISNPLNPSSGGLSYTFLGSENKDNREFKISSQQLRSDSNSKETKVKEQKSKRYGNLDLEIKTEKNIPVITSGRQEYRISVELINTENIESRINKGGTIKKNIVFPTHKIDIVF